MDGKEFIVKELCLNELSTCAFRLLGAINGTKATFIKCGLDGAEEFINKILEECANNPQYVKDAEDLKNGILRGSTTKNE